MQFSACNSTTRTFSGPDSKWKTVIYVNILKYVITQNEFPSKRMIFAAHMKTLHLPAVHRFWSQ